VLDLLTPMGTNSAAAAGSSTESRTNGTSNNNSNINSTSNTNSSINSTSDTNRNTAPTLSDTQRAMLGSVAARFLCGRVLLRGNPVLLPLLGHTLLCDVAAAVPAAPEVSAQEASVDKAAAGSKQGQAAWQVVAGVTQVVLLLQGVCGPLSCL